MQPMDGGKILFNRSLPGSYYHAVKFKGYKKLKVKKSSSSLTMDGFVNSHSSHRDGGRKIPKITESSNLFKSQAVKSKLKSTAQSVHKRTQKSHILMRSAVTKPLHNQKQSIKDTAAQVQLQRTPTNKVRNTRVQSIVKHANVKRFGHVAPRLKPETKKSTAVGEVIASPNQGAQSTTKAVTRSVSPSIVTSASHQHLERLLDEALAKADAHKRALHGNLPNQNIWQKIKRMPRWATFGTAFLFLVAAVSFYAWHNVPQVAVKVASTRAKVSAQVPSYTPSGFSFKGPIDYKEGSVHIKFKANTDSTRTYTLTQENSNMANKSLADTTLPDNTQVQTSEVAGTKVYIYGPNNDATWVNKGIKYTIKDSANLNPDQLLKIAGSL
jgi:hypothetical protein